MKENARKIKENEKKFERKCDRTMKENERK